MIHDWTDKFDRREFHRDAEIIDRGKEPFTSITIHHTWSALGSDGVPRAYGIPTDGRTTSDAQKEAAIRAMCSDHAVRLGTGPAYFYSIFDDSPHGYAIGKVGRYRRHVGGALSRTRLSVVYFGNLNHLQPSANGVKALREVIAQVRGFPFVKPGAPLEGHRDVLGSECPGDNLYALIPEIERPKGNADKARAHLVAAKREIDLALKEWPL